MNQFKIKDQIDEENKLIIQEQELKKEEERDTKTYKTVIEGDRVMNDFCFLLNINQGMVLIAIGMIVNFLYAAYDTYNMPKTRWSNPIYFPTLHDDTLFVGGMTTGWVITVLIPRMWAAYWFSYWLFDRKSESRLKQLPQACCIGAISTLVGTIWSIVNLVLANYKKEGGHDSKDTFWLIIHIGQTIVFVWFSGFTHRFYRQHKRESRISTQSSKIQDNESTKNSVK